MKNHTKIGLDPIVNENTEILILGSCPGDLSIQKQEYYANSNNQFWQLMSNVLTLDFINVSYKEKINLLLNNKIGLWDVMHSCIRKDSLDSSITDFEINEFTKLNLSKLKLILFNGNEAFKKKDLVNFNVDKRLLSSSSGVNSIPFEKKVDLWKKAFDNRVLDNDLQDKNNAKSEVKINLKENINFHIQKILREKNISRAKAVDMAFWLDQEGILKDSLSRPGKPLRDLLRDKKIKNAIQENGRFWYILKE